MAIIKKYRTLRPSTRKPSSISYRVNTDKVGPADTLLLTIYDEKKPGVPIDVRTFEGRDILGKNTIHFTALQQNGKWEIRFTGVNPIKSKKE